MTESRKTFLPRALPWLFALVAAAIYIGDYALLTGPHFQTQPRLLRIGVLVDVLIVVPCLYLFLVWRRDYPRVGLLLLLYGGATFAYALLPPEQNWVREALPYWRIAMLIAAGGMLVVVLIRISRVLRLTQQQQIRGEARVVAVADAVAFGKPALSRVLRSEFLTLYYALFGARREPQATPGQQRFTYHLKTGAVGMLIGFTVFQLPEIPLLHLLLAQWSPALAWLLTGLSCYGLALGPALAYAMKHRPILLDDRRLLLQMSLVYEAEIPLAAIAEVRAVGWRDDTEPLPARCLRAHMLAGPNLEIRLQHELIAQRMFGWRQRFDRVRLYVDEPQQLLNALQQAREGAMPAVKRSAS